MHRDRMKKTKKEKNHGRIRAALQLGFACFLNGYAAGFAGGKIFTGKTKALCVPVLNCYSCPGALGACPIGSLQAALGKTKGKFPFYVLGTMVLFGVIFGRLLCGFVCPFGFIQDLLYKIPGKKLTVPKKLDKPLRFLKYIVLSVFVIILPLFVKDSNGISVPWFCKYICPAGTLEAGLPLIAENEMLRRLVGGLFGWKATVLAVILLSCIFISRSFCRYLCPLGAFYALFNKFSLYRLNLDGKKCIGCNKCNSVCPMALEVTKSLNSPECIRCGKCKASCPTEAISSSFIKLKGKYDIPETPDGGKDKSE